MNNRKTLLVRLFSCRYNIIVRKKLGNPLDLIYHAAMENEEKKFVVTLR
jgi:hypothetical protein